MKYLGYYTSQPTMAGHLGGESANSRKFRGQIPRKNLPPFAYKYELKIPPFLITKLSVMLPIFQLPFLAKTVSF